MPIDKETKLGEVRGYYRTVLVAALSTYTKALNKARKSEEAVDGETEHLDERESVVKEFELCLGAETVRSIADTPIGNAIREGESRVIGIAKPGDPAQETLDLQDPLTPDGVDLSDDCVLSMMLDLAGYRKEPAAIAKAIELWALDTRVLVYRWARAMQIVGQPGVYVKVPDRPDVVLLEWLDVDLFKQVQEAIVEPETHSEIQMSPEEVIKWVSAGPWFPYLVTTEPERWSLRYNSPSFEEGTQTLPKYEFEHSSEGQARKIAAAINRRLATDLGVASTLEASSTSAPMTELEIIGWHARGPWQVTPDVDLEAGEDPTDDSFWTLEYTWPGEPNTIAESYGRSHETEEEARAVAADLNRKYAAAHPTNDEPKDGEAFEQASDGQLWDGDDDDDIDGGGPPLDDAPAVDGPTEDPPEPEKPKGKKRLTHRKAPKKKKDK